MIPVTAITGETTWSTSLFPRDGGYLLPVKVAVQRAEALRLDDIIEVRLTIAGV